MMFQGFLNYINITRHSYAPLFRIHVKLLLIIFIFILWAYEALVKPSGHVDLQKKQARYLKNANPVFLIYSINTSIVFHFLEILATFTFWPINIILVNDSGVYYNKSRYKDVI